jgi:hypothetical protein
MSKKRTSEIGLLTPQWAPLTPAQEREAVALLAELLLDVTAKRRGLHSVGVLGSASDGAIGSVVRFPEEAGKARDAA